VLIDVDDVQPRFGEEAGDRRDQPRPIGAGEQQARGVGVRSDQGIMPIRGAMRLLEPKARNERDCKVMTRLYLQGR
jgi:hypothetical protein